MLNAEERFVATSIADQLIHTTVRIETTRADGNRGSGTGFFMQFCEEEGRHIPVIVTNRHVVMGANTGSIHLTIADEENAPKLGEKVRVPLSNIAARWIAHPDPKIDLAAMPIAEILAKVEARDLKVYFKSWSAVDLADSQFLDDLTAIENILMVGYPSGLWDRQNNLPIVRRGITATPPYVDFESRPEFIIDCACFPGSSGSPVILYDVGVHVAKAGGVQLGGGRFKLLGVLYAGPQHTAEGEIRMVPVPTAMKPVVQSQIPINLGYCVKANQLMALEKHFASIVGRQARDGQVKEIKSSEKAA